MGVVFPLSRVDYSLAVDVFFGGGEALSDDVGAFWRMNEGENDAGEIFSRDRVGFFLVVAAFYVAASPFSALTRLWTTKPEPPSPDISQPAGCEIPGSGK
ncbi:MAG TPA: hypothetical protein PLU30_15075, partial [Verrucomicrobiae bacterium]|nr:hypothetical protein [Verrucomicrobiae bacterium]